MFCKHNSFLHSYSVYMCSHYAVIVSKCARHTAASYLTDRSSVHSSITDDCSLLSTFVFAWRPDNATLLTVTLRIMQLHYLQFCSLELSTSSCLRLIFIIILLLQPFQLNYLAGCRVLIRHSTFVID